MPLGGSNPVSIIDAFPKRSLQVPGKAKKAEWVGLPIFLAPGVIWLLWLFILEIHPLLDEYRLHNTGTLARASQVSNVWVFNTSYNHYADFDLRYVTEDGISHNKHVHFDNFSHLNESFPSSLIVRYDPASPEHISTSYGADYLTGRTIHVGIWSALPAGWISLLPLIWLWGVRADRAARLKLAAIAAKPTAEEADLTGAKAWKYSAEVAYSWKDSRGHALNGSFAFKRDQAPFWLDTARTKILAVSGPNGESVLLDAGLTLFNLTDQERERVVQARMEALGLTEASVAELNKPLTSNVATTVPAATPTSFGTPLAMPSTGNEPISVIDAFPRRSLKVPSEDKALEWAVFGIFLAPGVIWLSWLFIYEIHPLLDEYRLHNAGTVAKATEVRKAHVYNSRFNNYADFDLRYVTEDGISHSKHVNFDNLSYLSESIPSSPVVRYDPASPEHISTSYGADYLIGRTIHVGFWSAIPAVWICLCPFICLRGVRDDRAARLKLTAIAAQPTAVEANLTSVDGTTNFADIAYTWKDSRGHALNGLFKIERDKPPFWLDTARTKMLALSGPNGESVLLDAGLTLINLTDRERERVIQARVEALGLTAASAAELNKPLVDIAAAAVAGLTRTADAAATAATEAAKKDIKDGYLFATDGGRLADAAAASATGNKGIRALLRFLLVSGVIAIVVAVVAGAIVYFTRVEGIYFLIALFSGLYGFSVLIAVAKIRLAARSMPDDRGRLS